MAKFSLIRNPAANDPSVGDINQLQGRYDLIFSTFVLEHVAAPVPFLTEVNRLLLLSLACTKAGGGGSSSAT